MSRQIVWFSCGAASAVAAKLEVQRDNSTIVVYCDTGGEHPDNTRFLRDCEQWIGKDIAILKNHRYTDHRDVFRKTRYLVGIAGARCTTELKKRLRMEFQEPDDTHIFGYTIEERERAKSFEKNNPDLKTRWTLIEHQLTKEDCIGMIWRAGIEIPVMYKLGYNHNNCLGCAKGGAGYWNRIRQDFPDVFAEQAKIEREIGATSLRDKDGNRIYLDELAPDAGNFEREPDIQCGIGCEIAYQSTIQERQ